MKKLVAVVGTRPELVKLAPVVHAARAGGVFDPVVVSTGQHADMVSAMAADFDIEVHHEFDRAQAGWGLSGLVARLLDALPPVYAKEQPDVILVQGDTGSALAGALAGFYERVQVAHLEAGLRTANLSSPFPEEANRQLISRLAALHLAPTAASVRNLIREGVRADRIELVGNTVVDALFQIRRKPAAFADRRVSQWLDGAQRTVLVTMHRRESWGAGAWQVARAVRTLAQTLLGIRLLVVTHPNPIAREPFEAELAGLPGVLLAGPLGYGEMAHALGRVALVLTDSGGIQEEAPSLGTPVLVLRDETERVEAVAAGAAKLVGFDTDRIVGEARRLLVTDPSAYREMARPRNIYGDGQAAKRAVLALERLVG